MNPLNTSAPNLPISANRLVLNIRELPAVPGIVADALRILDDPSSSAEEIGAVVQRDQALAAKSLRVVNSAAFGLTRRIGTIREAIVMIGVRKIRGMVSAMATAGVFATGIPGVVEPKHLWVHSLAASTWATEIVEFRKLWNAQSAVIGALLHDLGVVVLCQYATDRYRGVLQMAQAEQFPLHGVEMRELGTTHAFVGAALCAKWQLPPGITRLVEQHHAYAPTVDKGLEVVVLANYLAHLHGARPFEKAVAPTLPDGLTAALGLDAELMAKLQSRKDGVLQKTNALLAAAEGG